jgi:hypothetical protein
MRNLLAEYPAWFEPDEVQILIGAFDKAWATVQATRVVYAEAKAETVRTILAKHIIEAAKQGAERSMNWTCQERQVSPCFSRSRLRSNAKARSSHG